MTESITLHVYSESGGSQPTTLQQVRLPVVSNTDCNARYGTIIESKICAGDTTTGGVDSCQASESYCKIKTALFQKPNGWRKMNHKMYRRLTYELPDVPEKNFVL